MNIQNIRNTFSKGIIVTNDRNIVATYVFKERWFAQSITKQNINYFENLLGDSLNIAIQANKGKYIRFVFNGAFNNENRIYDPIDKEVTLDELKEIIDNSEIVDPYGLYEAFRDVDFTDDYEVSNAFKNVLKRMDNKTDNASEELVKKWNEMLETANYLKIFSITGTSEPNEGNGCGYVECYIKIDKQIMISDTAKRLLEKLVFLSSEVCIEGNINNSELVFTFFS